MSLNDEVEGRGPWMQTNSGGQFFPLDPRVEEIKANDIANGLALDCRYAGQGRIDRFYSVAEHCVKMARFAHEQHRPAQFCLAVLLHDAAEAYINDLNRATKQCIGGPYKALERSIQNKINEKYDLLILADYFQLAIKDLDRRIVPIEKAAIEPVETPWQHPWAYDKFGPEALEGLELSFWNPPEAKAQYLDALELFCHLNKRDIEGVPL